MTDPAEKRLYDQAVRLLLGHQTAVAVSVLVALLGNVIVRQFADRDAADEVAMQVGNSVRRVVDRNWAEGQALRARSEAPRQAGGRR